MHHPRRGPDDVRMRGFAQRHTVQATLARLDAHLQPRNHNAVAAAVAQRRADWGMTLDTIARGAGLGFLPVQAEQYDFVVPLSRTTRPGVIALKKLLEQASTREALARLGMKP